MKLNIQVTQENIDNSRREQKCACPIALAVMDELVANHGARKHLTFASIDQKEGRCGAKNGTAATDEFDLPKAAQEFIVERDAKRPVAPFNFSVETRGYAPELQLTIMRKQHGMIP